MIRAPRGTPLKAEHYPAERHRGTMSHFCVLLPFVILREPRMEKDNGDRCPSSHFSSTPPPGVGGALERNSKDTWCLKSKFLGYPLTNEASETGRCGQGSGLGSPLRPPLPGLHMDGVWRSGESGASRGRRVTRGPARALASFHPFKNEPQSLFRKFPVSTEKDHQPPPRGPRRAVCWPGPVPSPALQL